jgi:hypothetical protein
MKERLLMAEVLILRRLPARSIPWDHQFVDFFTFLAIEDG